jgi:hypothetical protein
VGIAGALLLLAAVVIIVYFAITVPVEGSFGERYVTTVISPPYPLDEITTFKPVTLISYFTFSGTVLILEAAKRRLGFGIRGLRAFLITASFAAAYEFLWNMFAWFTTWLREGGTLDLIANTFHNHTFPPVNYNFATKISFLIFALCLYVWYFLGKVESAPKSANK